MPFYQPKTNRVVEARQVDSEADLAGPSRLVRHPVKFERILGWGVVTKHGFVESSFGDYLVTDLKGDWWPVRAEQFAERYEEVLPDEPEDAPKSAWKPQRRDG